MSQKRTPPPRPVSYDSVLTGQVVAIIAALGSGVGLALGLKDSVGPLGGAFFAVPVVTGGAVFFGLSALWHRLMPAAARARDLPERAWYFCLGFIYFGIGLACAGWFLVSIIGGVQALQNYHYNFVDTLRAREQVIAQNISIEKQIPAAVASGADNLFRLANAESLHGVISKKLGEGSVFATLHDAGQNLADKAKILDRSRQEQLDALALADEAINGAARDAAANDGDKFAESAATAAKELRKASNIRLDVTDLGLGPNTGRARAAITETINDIVAIKTRVNEQLQPVNIPVFRPIDAKEAVRLQPPTLPWLAATAVEALPLLMLMILLTVWRDPEEKDDEGNDGNAPPKSEVEPRPRPSLVAAE